ncbi:MAG: mitochondrial fission ELM1 family protein [Bdellovibrionales bacterium]
MENQCLGLAARVGCRPVIKRVVLNSPFKQLAPFLRLGLGHAFASDSDQIMPPWPDIMIASGRAGAMACFYAKQECKRRSVKAPFTVYIQNPVVSPSLFDLVALPRHDCVSGSNVVATRGSLHRVTPELLEEESQKFLPSLRHLKTPLVAVLIGGSNAVYRLLPEEMKKIATQLAALAEKENVSLLITTSRRTGTENVAILKEALQSVPHVLWTGEGPNPYYAFLGLAEAILVTADSVNMVSEACSTGKPVHIIPLEGGSKKFRRFHQVLQDDGLTRVFKGELERWQYEPLDDVGLVAARVRGLL